MDELHVKLAQLKGYLAGLGSVAVAFSSGVDSTLLLAVAHEVLGDKCIAVTAVSPFFPPRETEESETFCESRGIKQIIVEADEMSIPGFSENRPDRCYTCKKSLFGELINVARANGAKYVCEGSNMDDNGDYRPGLIAIAEMDVKSPLRVVGLSKAEIRELSRELGLPTWKKPSFACLASRIPYGEEITSEKLHMVDLAEEKLRSFGFGNLRVRVHGNLARIELEPEEIERFLDKDIRSEVDAYFKDIGFTYVSLELSGYSVGSLNRSIEKEELEKETAAQAAVARPKG